jgi:hypothetical protein
MWGQTDKFARGAAKLPTTEAGQATMNGYAIATVRVARYGISGTVHCFSARSATCQAGPREREGGRGGGERHSRHTQMALELGRYGVYLLP